MTDCEFMHHGADKQYYSRYRYIYYRIYIFDVKYYSDEIQKKKKKWNNNNNNNNNTIPKMQYIMKTCQLVTHIRVMNKLNKST